MRDDKIAAAALDKVIDYARACGDSFSISLTDWEGELADHDEDIASNLHEYSCKPYDSEISKLIRSIVENHKMGRYFYESIFGIKNALEKKRQFTFADLYVFPNSTQLMQIFQSNEIFTENKLEFNTCSDINLRGRGFEMYESRCSWRYLSHFKNVMFYNDKIQLYPHSILHSLVYRGGSRADLEYELRSEGKNDSEIKDVLDSPYNGRIFTINAKQLMLGDAIFPNYVRSLPVLLPVIAGVDENKAKTIIRESEAYIGRAIRKINDILESINDEDYNNGSKKLIGEVESIISDEIAILTKKMNTSLSKSIGLMNAGAITSTVPLTISAIGFFTDFDPSIFNFTESSLISASGLSLSQYLHSVRLAALEDEIVQPDYRLIWNLSTK